jgi:hypothetical protein
MRRTAAPRIDVLARRVRWLDRYRRVLSMLIATVVWFVLMYELDLLIGSGWPGLALPVFLAAATVWWIVEVAFAWAIALWETEHDRLMRGAGLPVARIVRHRERTRAP